MAALSVAAPSQVLAAAAAAVGAAARSLLLEEPPMVKVNLDLSRSKRERFRVGYSLFYSDSS